MPLWDDVDPHTASVLALVAGDRIHRRDRALIVAAVLEVGREHGGLVDPNRVRERLCGRVYPACVGAVYAALRRAGVLEPAGWTTSTDTAGRNTGKPCRTYRVAAQRILW